VGIHPHDGANFVHAPGSKEEFTTLIDPSNKKLVAIGECGLDYYYEHSSREDQIGLLEFQLQLAVEHDMPVIFHVRDAFDDFWPIFDNFKGLRGVVHSFSSTPQVLHEVLKRELHVGLNGIMTFTKDPLQLEAAKIVPRGKLLLETDAPYLTPKPFRGKVCKPEHTRLVAIFLSELRGESLEVIAQATTSNAQKLFGLQ
jgi:TatD DNase family protein